MASYVMKVGFFIDGSRERFQPFSARVDLGPFRRHLTNEEVQQILYAAKIEYGRIIRESQEEAS